MNKKEYEIKDYGRYCGHLTLEDIFTTDSVLLCARKAARGFMRKSDTYTFMKAENLNSYRLCQKVLEGKFKPKYYRTQVITERGKQRTIKPPVFESKVVQKVLDEYLIKPLFIPKMISTNYSSVEGRGTEKMYTDIQKALLKEQSHKEKVIVMTDYRNFFGSIDIEKLRGIYERYIADERLIDLILSFAEDGLSLGNETSQVPASFFPSMIDHYFKDRLGIEHYFRYADDVLFIADDIRKAEELIDLFKSLSADLRLNCPDEKIKIVPIGESFTFCKERFLYDKKKETYFRMINPQIIRNEKRKLNAFAEKGVDEKEIEGQYKGVRGMIASRENTAGQIKKLDMLYARRA